MLWVSKLCALLHAVLFLTKLNPVGKLHVKANCCSFSLWCSSLSAYITKAHLQCSSTGSNLCFLQETVLTWPKIQILRAAAIHPPSSSSQAVLLTSVVLASWVISCFWSYFHIFFPTKLTSVDNINDWRVRAEVVSSFQYFGHYCLQQTSSYDHILGFWRTTLCPWVQWNPKVHDSVETGIKFLAWLLAFCVTLDPRMRHLIPLCFHSSKCSGTNSPQKLQDNSGWQEGRSPAPTPAQSRLSCGLWLSCSGLRPVRA